MNQKGMIKHRDREIKGNGVGRYREGIGKSGEDIGRGREWCSVGRDIGRSGGVVRDRENTKTSGRSRSIGTSRLV